MEYFFKTGSFVGAGQNNAVMYEKLEYKHNYDQTTIERKTQTISTGHVSCETLDTFNENQTQKILRERYKKENGWVEISRKEYDDILCNKHK